MRLSNDLVSTYERDGTVVVPNLFDDWIEPLSKAVLGVIDRDRRGIEQPLYPGFEYLNPLNVIEEFGGGAMALNVFPHDPTFGHWLEESPAAEITASAMKSKRVRFWVDACFYKDQEGAAEGTPWHNDTCTWPFWGQQMTILWIALTDIGPEDSPLTTVRGSHVGDGRYYSPFFPPQTAPPAPYKPWSELMALVESPSAEIQSWTLQAGDCLLMHPSTVHGSAPRRSSETRPRLSFSTRWLGDDVVWKPDSLTAPMTERLNNDPRMVHGGPPPESVIPVIWTDHD